MSLSDAGGRRLEFGVASAVGGAGALLFASALLASGLLGYGIATQGSGSSLAGSSSPAVDFTYICPDGSESRSRDACLGMRAQGGCVPEAAASSSSATTSTTEPGAAGEQVSRECVCTDWECTGPSTTSSSSSSTSTTSTSTTVCTMAPWPDYEPMQRDYALNVVSGKFRPKRIEAFVGDSVRVTIRNEEGLYKIRDQLNNRSIVLRPNQAYVAEFEAGLEGEFLLGCTELCEDPIEAWIIVSKPHKRVCV